MHTLEISYITQTDEFYSLQSQWNALNERSSNGTLFSSWEWLYSWWEIYHQDATRELYILCCHHQGQLIGIAPLQILDHPKRYFPCSKQLLLLGTGETDGGLVFSEYLDLIIEPGLESRVTEAFSQALMQQQQYWQGALFSQLLADSNLSHLFSGQNLSIRASTTTNGFRTLIELPETYKDYLMSLRKKKRNNITRMLTRLQNEQTYCIEAITEGLDIDAAISDLADLNRERREHLEQPSAFHQANFERFHRLVVKRLLPLNKVQIRMLKIDGKSVAGLYCLIDRGIVHAYQCGFEASLGHRYALLTMMITQEISHAIDHPELTHFNFMYSADENSYKLRYSAYTEPMYDVRFFPNNKRTQVHQFIHGPLKKQVKALLKKQPT